jgi:hypothetical protein
VSDKGEDEVAGMAALHRELDPQHAKRLEQACGIKGAGVDGVKPEFSDEAC